MLEKLHLFREDIVHRSAGLNVPEPNEAKFKFETKLISRHNEISSLIADLHDFRAHLALQITMSEFSMEQDSLRSQDAELVQMIGMLRSKRDAMIEQSVSLEHLAIAAIEHAAFDARCAQFPSGEVAELVTPSKIAFVVDLDVLPPSEIVQLYEAYVTSS